MPNRATTLGELKQDPRYAPGAPTRTVKDEMRENVLKGLASGKSLFPGVHGYEETVLPQIVNALLARHNFILLGLRGQAKSRILRGLVNFLDPEMPYLEGCEIHDHPLRPLCKSCRDLVGKQGDAAPIAWRSRANRYVEKLATPDVTIADILGDVDPIKAARSGRALGDELTVHYGLLPRANRGIFAINELPDLAGKIQVGLFNIMQEGDVQIKGYPVRLPLDVVLVFTANPEDYTARGKIISPLKDRMGAEIRTHYPASVEEGMSITAQEAWIDRPGSVGPEVPGYLRETIEEIAFIAREDKRVDKRSGVSQRLPIACLESVVSSAEQRAARNREARVSARVADLYAALPAITGKLELEYEGELRGAESIARELVRSAVGKVFTKHLSGANLQAVMQWFEAGNELKVPESAPASEALKQMRRIEGLLESAGRLLADGSGGDPALAAAAEFVLEGLWAHKRISRSEERGFYADRPKLAEPREPVSRPPRRQFN
ncbi:MAG TPA: magnesium chelatase [Methylomirabilota bacterium]|nr:magnesium chelatase [Methylomirabilota bacterium]